MLDPVGNIIVEDSNEKNLIDVDFALHLGKIKPLNGLNNGPGFVMHPSDADLSAWWEVLNVPMARLHDTTYTNPDTVDIHCVFPDFNADPDDPASYRFGRTDTYIKAIVELGIPICYRLGESIDHSDSKCYIDPPEDTEKWAKICLGIIKHYNDGWADGFNYNIKHWEVWCEPDQCNLWSGTWRQYYELYGITARVIKDHDGRLQVGGPSSSGTGDFQDGFLKYCREKDIPLDFYSAHCYASSPHVVKECAEHHIKLLETFGFDKTDFFLTEWHYFSGDFNRLLRDPIYSKAVFECLNGPAGAAFIASTLIMLQDTKTAMANHYTGDCMRFGLFDLFKVPYKAYYAFKAFAELLEMSGRVSCRIFDYQVEAAAAVSDNEHQAILLLSNFDSQDNDSFNIRLNNSPRPGAVSYEIYVVDDVHNLDQVSRHRISSEEKRIIVDCPAPSIRLIKFFWK